MRIKMSEFWRREYQRQLEWIREHGETLAGYVARYGSVNDLQHYGEGGEAIYQADINALRRIEDRVAFYARYTK